MPRWIAILRLGNNAVCFSPSPFSGVELVHPADIFYVDHYRPANQPNALPALHKTISVRSCLVCSVFLACRFRVRRLTILGAFPACFPLFSCCLLQVNIGDVMRAACLDMRARDVELGVASMDTFTPIVLELLTREWFLAFVCFAWEILPPGLPIAYVRAQDM